MSNKNSTESIQFTPVDELNYETAFEELNSVVDKLENEDLTLEEALTFFERGQELAKRCAYLLDQSELKVEQIIGDDRVDFDFKRDQ